MISHPTQAALLGCFLCCSLALAQPFSGGENTRGDLEIRANPNNNGTGGVRAYFGASKGAYANALQFLSPSSTNVCSYLNAGQASCLGYTGECSATISPSTACGSDPNGSPSEISCFCRDPSTLFGVPELGTISPGGASTVSTSLLIDRNVDARQDGQFFSSFSSNPNNNDQLRSYQLFPGLFRLDWEDQYSSPSGDFNDYTAYIEARSCDDEPQAPFYSIPTADVQVSDCYDNCYKRDPTCPAGSPVEGLRFAASISIDSLVGGERESRGRLLHLTVATYDINPRNRVAVCPSIVFNSPNSYAFTPLSFGVEQTPVDLCRAAAVLDGSPRCGAPVVIPNFWSVSLAREQRYAPICGPYTGGGDAFTSSPLLTCGKAAPHFETYEIALQDVDSTLDPADQLSALDNADIINALYSVRLDIFEGIQSFPFHCGSGVNISRYTSNPNVATASTQSIVKGPSTLNIATIDRQ